VEKGWQRDFYSRWPTNWSRKQTPVAGLPITNFFFSSKWATPQSQDKLIYERSHQKEWLLNAVVTDDGRYLIITVQRGSDPKNRVFYKTWSTQIQCR